jgi:hypothetical protein
MEDAFRANFDGHLRWNPCINAEVCWSIAGSSLSGPQDFVHLFAFSELVDELVEVPSFLG